MEEKVYVVARTYEYDGTSVVCFKNKEKAKTYAIQTAQKDHKYFEFEKHFGDNFENCCYNTKIYMGESTIIWSYICANLTIELSETTLE